MIEGGKQSWQIQQPSFFLLILEKHFEEHIENNKIHQQQLKEIQQTYLQERIAIDQNQVMVNSLYFLEELAYLVDGR